MPQLVETALWESTASATKTGVFEDVKILGQRSKNKRYYTEAAMKAAVGLYEGKAVYISHAGEKVKHRPAPERYGRLTNVRYDADRKQLRGNLVYLESQQQMTAMVREDLERKLNFFGLSHVADGQYHVKEGLTVVTSIDRVESVDLVSDPATATSLREQEDAPGAAPAAEAGPDHKVEALRAGLNAIFDGGGDVAGMIAKITEFLETFGDAAAEPAEGETAAPEPAKEQTAGKKFHAFGAKAAKSLAEQVAELTAQVAALSKPKKYVTAAPAASKTLQEQTTPLDAAPSTKDKAALRKWLMSK